MKQESAEYLNNFGGELVDDYSGRGMYGATTYALTFDSQHEFHAALADAIESINDDSYGEPEEQQKWLCNLLRSLKMDNMGMGIIIY